MSPFTMGDLLAAAAKAEEKHGGFIEPLFLKLIVKDLQARLGNDHSLSQSNHKIFYQVLDDFEVTEEDKRNRYKSAVGYLWNARKLLFTGTRGKTSNVPRARREDPSPYTGPAADGDQFVLKIRR